MDYFYKGENGKPRRITDLTEVMACRQNNQRKCMITEEEHYRMVREARESHESN